MKDLQRRQILKAGLAGLAMTIPGWTQLSACAGFARAGDQPLLGFQAVPVNAEDKVVVPPGYRAQVLYRWGDAVGVPGAMPEFRMDGSNTAAEQALQAGMHHDHIEYFPLQNGNALLAVNHEYTDDGLLHADGMTTWTADKVRKSQAAHGVAIVEVAQEGNEWKLVRPSKYARRITAYTPMSISGPAAGHELLRTMADPAGREVLGTFNNCAGGMTPWGTYLTCEENFNMYFVNAAPRVPAEQARYGINARGGGYRWHEFDGRFDAQLHPNEPNRHGYVVEIDPYDPHSRPVKRTALGRFKHEAAMVTLAEDGRVVVYMGDDERFEYMYKFVSRRRFDPKDRASNRTLLDDGTLYAARFDDNGQGQWIALPARPEALIQTRQAADSVGASKMDRPEWVAVHPRTGDVYLALTNNDRRGTPGQPAVDAANPRAQNVYGQILKWREQGGDAASLKFRWEMFALAGEERGFGSPDGLWFDQRGVLWIQTDVAAAAMNRGPYAKIGNNQMLAADVSTGEIRRFLTGPIGCEITGAAMSPDGRTLFINVQHPGEPPTERNNPAAPRAISNWPDFLPHGRPRAGTLAIRREDGGLVET
jgi:uncharacterized protein